MNWIELENKVVIVTGGSLGIGETVVEELIKVGAKVIVADLKTNPKFATEKNITFIECDVSNKKSVDSMVDATIELHGRIDALINNAGVSRPRMLVDYYGKKPEYELSEDDFDFMVSVNQKGVFLCSQSVARQMIKQNKGVIINMSSEAGIEGSKGQSAYSATKAAVHAFGLAWAKELGQFNIRVIGIAPGINVRTPMNSDSAFEALAYARGQDPTQVHTDYSTIVPLGRQGQLKEISDLILYLISDRASYITGTTINITGGKSKG